MQVYRTVMPMNYIHLSALELSDEVASNLCSDVERDNRGSKVLWTRTGGKYSTLRKLKQGANPPVMVPGRSASALGNVNDAPTIASAEKLLRRCDRRRF